MNKVKKLITQRLENPQGLVSSLIKPFRRGTANIEAKLMEKIALCNMMYLRAFGTSKDLLTGKTNSHLIDNPDPRVKNIDTSDWTDQDWINYTKDWNYYVSNIIELERECEYMFKVLEKSNIVKQIDEREIFNYDNDTYAHTETYGRWRFTKKALKRHKLKHAKK